MRSCGSAIVVAALLGAAVALRAQAPTAEASYKTALAQEAELRRQMEAPVAPSGQAALIRNIRNLVRVYDAIAVNHPTSGYSDNALWQGGLLAADAFRQFGQTADRDAAQRMMRGLRARFPSSSLVARIPEQLARLEQSSTGAPPATTVKAVAGPSAPAVVSTAIGPATLTAIRREVLPDAVRITLSLEHETSFQTERLENPARLAVDLKNTRAVYDLKDARLAFEDDVVRQVRVGRQDGVRIRVVLDLVAPGRYSVYPVYNPYRLVIDFERQGKAGPAPSFVAASGPPRPSASSSPAAGRGASSRDADRSTPAATLKPTAAAPTERPARSPAIGPAPAVPGRNGRGGFSISRQLGLGVSRIVIDPGHGGHDPGARVNGLTEAELVLDVALRLEKLLLAQPEAQVVLTRRTSEFVPLDERTRIANKANADLFLSIHANASTNTAARGIETYFLNFAQDAQSEALAARENAGSSRTMSNLNDIVKAITLNNKIDESRDFARLVQSALYTGLRKTNKQVKDLGVKQAPFQVLIGASMPSILAEISFITNGGEGKLLKTGKYRDEIAVALFNGILNYQKEVKKGVAVAKQ
jgi:N-acetylmuramoyl-L-alanine amidase